MPLYCKISHDPDKVIVRGVGPVTYSDIEQYLAATIREGAKGYAKLFLLGDSKVSLSPAELDAVAHRLIAYGRGEPPGPVAIVAGTQLNLDMAVLLKQRVGARPFSIFIDALQAARWLDKFAQPRVRRIAPEGWTSPDQPGRTTVVASSWETMAGPASVSPAPSAARS
jgi:hypothetical protein